MAGLLIGTVHCVANANHFASLDITETKRTIDLANKKNKQ